MNMKKLTVLFIVLCLSLLFFIMHSVTNINYNMKEFSLANQSFEKNYCDLTKKLKRKNFINGYLVSSIEYYPKRGIGNVVYSNVHNNNVVFVIIEDNMFKSAVRYGVFSKESDKLWGLPIDIEKINIHSSDLEEILKANDATFSESNISYLRLYNNARNKILWECYYDDADEGHKIAETNANTGEIVRMMGS